MFVDGDAGDLLLAISLVLRKPVRGEWFKRKTVPTGR